MGLGAKMSPLNRDFVYLVLQFLYEENFKETSYKLEQEFGLFFNMKRFENMVKNGAWEEVEKYLCAFTNLDDNRYSLKIFFEIRKQKYLEALDRQDRAKAMDILVKELKRFATFNDNHFREITQLLTLENIRDSARLSNYGDTKSARGNMLAELNKLIVGNPLFRDKLHFPILSNSRLRVLINQSLNWQHLLCKKKPGSKVEIKSLFVDHICGQSYGATAPFPVTGAVAVAVGFPVLTAHDLSQSMPAAVAVPLSSWLANPLPLSHPSASAGIMSLNTANNAVSTVKHPRIPPNNPPMDNQTPDSEHMLKGLTEEVNTLPIPAVNQSHGQSSCSKDLPKKVVTSLNLSLEVKSIDFHPVEKILLLVGTSMGDAVTWEVGSPEIHAFRNFEVWELGACSAALKESLVNDNTASINRMRWSPDGALFGVAYSKHLVHLYAHNGGDDLRNHLEIEAHVGNVYDLAFAYPKKQLYMVTCGEDRAIKVWDTVTGSKQHSFEGQEAPVYSICPHHRETIPFILSTATDGKIKVWLYDNKGSRVEYDAPGKSSTIMSYGAGGTRLFSCGTNKDGESYLVEWNEREGGTKRTYCGLAKQSVGLVQFDISKNGFLAAGDDFLVKFWDMDNPELLTSNDAEGGLPCSPCIRFNQDGLLLAVSTNNNGIKILANTDGMKLLRTVENCTFDIPRAASAAIVKSPTIGTCGSVSKSVGTSIGGRSPPEINEPAQCRSLRLPDDLPIHRVSRLIYTNSGLAILALPSNGVHKLWKWQINAQNLTGKATTNILPQLWRPSSGRLMTNDISNTNPEDAVPCFALSKNDSYVVSASGGKISLFNMVTFKTIAIVKPPPPAATSLALHPLDNNVFAIGMDDSSIQIYNSQNDLVETKLQGHNKRVTGLAFSNILHVLVSSGADSQLCVWSTNGWNKEATKFLKIPTDRAVSPLGDTYIQFHSDQTHLLTIHKTQLAILEAAELKFLKQWVPEDARGPITHATHSCDSLSIYASFEDGSVGVLTTSTLSLRYLINPNAYFPYNPSSRVHPLVIAAHPSEPNQFAVGLTDGAVYVIEPPESDGKWGTSPSENVLGQSTPSEDTMSDQPTQR